MTDRGRLVVVVVVLALVAFALAPSLRFPYVWDAGPAVARNALVQRGSIREIVTSDYWRGTAMPDRTLYRPVTVLSFAVERHARGVSDPRISHLVNALLHAATAVLLIGVARRVGAREEAAALAGLLFAGHPLLLLTAVNIAGRADILATLFSLAAIACVAGAREHPRAAAWCGAAFLLLALGSKESALATPALMAIAVILTSRRPSILVPSSISLVVYVAMRTIAIEAFPGAQAPMAMDNVLVGAHGMASVATRLAMLGRYVGLLLWPHVLSADYSGAAIPLETSLSSPWPLAGLIALGALVSLVFSRSIVLRFGAALFLLPYLLVGNVVVLSGAGFAERLIYFSSAGFCLLAAAGLSELHRRIASRAPSVAAAAMVALLALLLLGIVQARSDARAWAGDETLLEATLRATPGSLRAHFALAEIRMKQRRDDEALRLYDEALRVSPTHEASWLYRGVIVARRGDLAEGERCARRALELQPDFGEARTFLGILLNRQGRTSEAERELRKAVASRPPILDARAELGLLRLDQGRYDEAAVLLRECVERGLIQLRPRLEEAERARAGGSRR